MVTLTCILGSIVALFLFYRFIFFFRNPDRKIVYDDRNILAPADGFVIYIQKVEPGQQIFSVKQGTPILLNDLMFIDDESLLDKPGWLVGISMTPFDIHYNRAPLGGTIRKIRHDFPSPKKTNADMFPGLQNMFFNRKPYYSDCEYIFTNERASYVIKNEKMSIYVTQIADNWIKKIVTFKDHTGIRQGEVFGLIRMGSQVDLFIPDEHHRVRLLAEERKHVKAGITTLARINE